MSTPSLRLARMELFKRSSRALSDDEAIALGYEQARASAKEYGLTIDDILHLTPKFWNYHQDLIHPASYSPFVLFIIQYNLAAGTIGRYLNKRPDLQSLMDSIMAFDVSAQFLLTEVGHGLDAKNMETTATLLPDGSFDLHSPTPAAAKFMPPTTPIKGFPRVAVVIARLIVAGEDRGVRPFVVWLNDGEKMYPGISSTQVPRRTATRPLDHSITSFNHVKLSHSSLLGALEKPKDLRANFLNVIQRVAIGTLSLSTFMLPNMKRVVYIAGKYSMRRHIGGTDGKQVPIISFRTQQQPIMHMLAQISVYEAFINDCIRIYMEPGLKPTVRHGIATIVKAVVNSEPMQIMYELTERCGAQGLFEFNGILQNWFETRGASIAEGDTLVLCIRLASELLLGRYEMPKARDPSSLIARHEQGIYDECREIMRSIKGDHRSAESNNVLLPRFRSLVEAIGNRMAYEAAVQAKVDPDLLALFEAGVILQDPSWYVQHAELTRIAQFEKESVAMNACLPRLEELLEATGAREYVHDVPIVSDENWSEFVKSLRTFKGEPQRELRPEDSSEPQLRSRL